MRPLPEHRPSWLSTILFALVAALLAALLGSLFGGLWSLPWTYVEHDPGNTLRELIAVWSFLGSGIGGFFVALWAWRAPREERFHITFWSGLLVLACTDAYAWCELGPMKRLRSAVDDWDLGMEKPEPYLVITQIIQQTALIPLVVAYGTAVGLVLLLVALALDRRQ